MSYASTGVKSLLEQDIPFELASLLWMNSVNEKLFSQISYTIKILVM